MNRPPKSSTCMGFAISDGTVGFMQESAYASFGLLQNGSFVLGTLLTSDVESFNFTQLLTGFNWLVRDGVPRLIPSTQIAARTAIGVDRNGTLLIFEADGVDGMSLTFLTYICPLSLSSSPAYMLTFLPRIPTKNYMRSHSGQWGLTLNQTADWMMQLGAAFAINLDGGGSSTFFFNGTVVNHPTSDDTGTLVKTVSNCCNACKESIIIICRILGRAPSNHTLMRQALRLFASRVHVIINN